MARLEVWGDDGRVVIPLEGHSITLGSAPSNGVSIADDPTVSRLHAVLENFGGGWCLNDLGSRNGTWVNGRRIFGQHHLHDGDDLRLGASRVVYRGDGELDRAPTTEVPDESPELTARERDVLLALCRPMLDGNVFTMPASVGDIATELSVTHAAVKQHLARLAEKFGVDERGERRRVGLANMAVQRGTVNLGDLAEPSG